MMDKLNMLAPQNQQHTPLSDLAQMWRKLINEISHLLYNNLSILQMCQISIDKNLPALIEGYSLAAQHHLIKNHMATQQIDEFRELLQLKESIDPMYKLLGGLQHYCAILCKEETKTSPCLASVCIEKILTSFPVSYHEHDLIHLNLKNDFALTVSPSLVSTLLTLIVAFAYHHIDGSQGDKIKISLKRRQQVNYLHCKIMTTTITEGICKHFFEQFFSLDSENISPGLGWYHLTLLHAGGNLSFTMKENHYVEFIIMLPKTDGQ